MALDAPYIDLATLKARLGIKGSESDAVLLQVILAASRLIDNATGRKFGRSDDATARYYTASAADYLAVDDLVSIVELATDDGSRTYPYVWSPIDYDLFQYAVDESAPFTEIRRAPYGTRSFNALPRGVRVTAIWGWPAVPAPIAEATAVQAARLYKRKDAPFGVTGSPGLGDGQLMWRVDPDVQALITPYRVTGF